MLSVINNGLCIEYGITNNATTGTVYLPMSYFGTYYVAFSTQGSTNNFHFAVAIIDKQLSYFSWSSYQGTHYRGWISVGF